MTLRPSTFQSFIFRNAKSSSHVANSSSSVLQNNVQNRKKGWTDQAEESRKRWIKTFMYVTEITKWSLSEIRALHYMEFFLLLDECTDRTKREAAAMKKK